MAQTLRTLIIEDELAQREILTVLLEKYCPGVEILAAADSVASGLRAIREHEPDLVFLDVELRDGDCFELLEQIAELPFSVVFVTAHGHYAIRAIKFSALDYLLKPVIVSELKTAVAKVAQFRESEQDRIGRFAMLKENLKGQTEELNRIALPTLEGFTFVEIARIVRLEADRSYTRVYFRDGESALISKSLGDFEDLLQRQNFFRIHNSHLINLREVQKYVKGKGGQVVLSDGSTVAVSTRRKDAFLERLKQC